MASPTHSILHPSPRAVEPARARAELLAAPSCMLALQGYFSSRARYRLYGDLSFLLLALPWIVSRWLHGA